MAIAMIMAIPTATMYVIRSVVVAIFSGAVVGVVVAIGALTTVAYVSAYELP